MASERPLLAVPRKDLDPSSRGGGSTPKHVRGPLPAAWIVQQLGPQEDGAMLGASRDGTVDLTVSHSGGATYLVRGKVHADVDTTCGRCLGPATIPVDAEITLLMVPSAAEAARAPRGKRSKESEGEFEFDPDEADVTPYEGDVLVLDPLVREALLLELPISPLCSDDCAGMAPPPAVAGEGGDPRLAKLAQFRPSKPRP